jgi:hypothetical protein
MQVAMVGLGLASSFLFVPDIRQIDKRQEALVEKKETLKSSTLQVLAKFNPSRIFGPLVYPNVLLAVSVQLHQPLPPPLWYIY